MMSTQETGLQNWVDGQRPPDAAPRLVAVTGGKGGVGKSNFSLNFGIALGQQGVRTLLIDCDSGLGNIDVLLGLCAEHHLGHVMAGEVGLETAITRGPGDLDILPAASGIDALGKATATEAGRLLKALGTVSGRYQAILFDTSAGLGPQVRAILRAAPEVLLVTTPEPTAMADAYATLKIMSRFRKSPSTQLVINAAENAREAEIAIASITTVAERFLGHAPGYLGFIPRDGAVPLAVKSQSPFVLAAPQSAAGRAVRALAANWLGRPEAESPKGDLWSLFRSLWGSAASALRPTGADGRTLQ